jgi:hypothetical protein
MAHSVAAFAIIDRDGQLLTDTVFGTHRGAKVNWLVKHANVPVFAFDNDASIARAFETFSKKAGVSCEQVAIVWGK